MVNGLTYIPSSARLRRDVSELLAEPKNEYLPPTAEETNEAEVATELPVEEAEVQDTAVLGNDGYEYKTVKRVVVRSRRDVSHLSLNYLPPLEMAKPSNEYLPPAASEEEHQEEAMPSEENSQPDETKQAEEVEMATEAPEPSKEYLPPAQETKPEAEEMTISETPNKEYLPPAKEEEKEKEPASEEVNEEKPNEEISNEEAVTDAPLEDAPAEVKEATPEAPIDNEETAFFAEDGYHYKQPSEVPMELMTIEQEPASNPETLAPLEEGVVEAEGPENGESAVLAEDGYHYRVIKRRF